MRVYFVGAHSTGKTTLARYVANEYNVMMLPEVARTVLAEKEWSLDSLRTDMSRVDEYQGEVFKRQLSCEEDYQSYGNFVSDRSFDNLAYMAQHSTMLSKFLTSEVLKKYIDTLKKDDVAIFFVRPCKATMKNDGVRESVCWDGIIAIDAMIKMLLEMFGLSYVSIASESMQERVRTIQAVLRNIPRAS